MQTHASFAERLLIHSALSDPHRLGAVDLLATGDLTSTDLAHRLGIPGNLLAHHLKVLEEAGLIERRISEGDARRRYIVLRHTPARSQVFDRDETNPVGEGKRVVFVCTHNSARSQFASALWRHRTGVIAESAGRTPAKRVHPMAIRVASEAGIDLDDALPRGYDQIRVRPDIVVSVCDRAGEETLPDAGLHLHWSVPDPVRQGGEGAFRAAFDEISARIDAVASAVTGSVEGPG